MKLIERTFYLDKLKDDKDYRVRLEVAKSGYFAHQLVKDPHPEVRKAALEKMKLGGNASITEEVQSENRLYFEYDIVFPEHRPQGE